MIGCVVNIIKHNKDSYSFFEILFSNDLDCRENNEKQLITQH